MESPIQTTEAKTQHLDKVVELESKIWPEGTRAPREKFESRLRVFPNGFFVAFKDDEMIGVSTSEIITYDPANPPASWEAITDNGRIRNTHNPDGDALYVVSVGGISRSGAGSALIKAQIELSQRLKLRCLILGARIPGYDSYCKEHGNTKIEDYAMLTREDGQLLDPELRFYTRNGLRLLKIIPNYMEDDRESRNYGAIMIFENR